MRRFLFVFLAVMVSLFNVSAQTPEDILWRRTKHDLHLTQEQRTAFADWFFALAE